MDLERLSERPRPRLVRALDLAAVPRAFRPEPLVASEMAEFYSDALDKQRASHLLRRIKDDLLETVEQGFFFKGILYGNRGTGKSTDINRLLDDAELKQRFLVVRLDALNELNPQTFSVADVLILLFVNLIESCDARSQELKRAFPARNTMELDLQSALSPYFPELQSKEEQSTTKGGGAEINLLQTIKLSLRAEGQKKIDVVQRRDTLTNLSATLDRQAEVIKRQLPGLEILVIGENFDKEQIPPRLLHDTFVQYASVFSALRLNFFFTLPVPFVYAYSNELAFRRENRYPIYDVPVANREHRRDEAGCSALLDLVTKRADWQNLFADDTLERLLRASGGDLYLLFALTVNAARWARYRHEDDPASEAKILPNDAEKAIREQLGIFRNELGTAPNDPDDTPWKDKLQKLRDIYEQKPDANVPDKTLYQLLRKRAVLFFNGTGRYGVHPLAVEILREQLTGDTTFVFHNDGLIAAP